MGFFSKKIDKKIESYQQELMETHYREVDNMYRQIRGWRHDYRNHIQTMKAYAAAEDLDAIKVYLDLLDEDLTTVDTVIKTGNPMMDAILNSKISLAKAGHIQVIADAEIPVKLKSSEIDLCCIIGNLFDNARDIISITAKSSYLKAFTGYAYFFTVKYFMWEVQCMGKKQKKTRQSMGTVQYANRTVRDRDGMYARARKYVTFPRITIGGD